MIRSSARFWRQQEIFLPDGTKTTDTTTIIGAGGIGSNVALSLARMGVGTLFRTEGDKEGKMIVWDGDEVEEHNLPTQMFEEAHISRKKVDALSDIIKIQTGLEIIPVAEMWEGQKPLEGVVIAGLDTMRARKMLWEKGLKFKANPLFIDGRMGAETALIYAARPQDPDDVDFYESELNTDEESPDLPCTARAILYNTLTIAALIANIYKRFATGDKFPRETIFDFPTLTLATRGVKL